MIEVREATKNQAAEIACLIMTAMTDDCCLHFCGEGYGLEDFRKMMTILVEREDSQYSYRNTLVAMDADKVVGISVSLLRQPKIISARTIQEWTMRRKQVNCILIPWPCFQNIAVRVLPESCCWLPRNGLIIWAYRVSDSW